MSPERIQKLLAEAGLASRRGAEELIVQGRVSVNGRVVVKLPCFVDPRADEVRLDGQLVRLAAAPRTYLLLHKPAGVECKFGGGGDRASVFDLVPQRRPLLCVAPLNTSDAGLVLLTDDGQLAQRIRHPRCRLVSRYRVELEGNLEPRWLERLRKGTHLGGRRSAAEVRPISRSAKLTVLEIAAGEGRNRELRRVLGQTGHRVRRMRRLALGPLGAKGLKTGAWRRLTAGEVRQLHQHVRESEHG